MRMKSSLDSSPKGVAPLRSLQRRFAPRHLRRQRRSRGRRRGAPAAQHHPARAPTHIPAVVSPHHGRTSYNDREANFSARRGTKVTAMWTEGRRFSKAAWLALTDDAGQPEALDDRREHLGGVALGGAAAGAELPRVHKIPPTDEERRAGAVRPSEAVLDADRRGVPEDASDQRLDPPVLRPQQCLHVRVECRRRCLRDVEADARPPTSNVGPLRRGGHVGG